MEDELKNWCEKVLNQLMSSEEATSLRSSAGIPWPAHQTGGKKDVSREGMQYVSSLPEDVIMTMRLFIDSVMHDFGSPDDGVMGAQRARQQRINFRPKRKGHKDLSSVDGTQHSKFRVLQFQGYVLSTVSSTLVWLRDVISSLVTSVPTRSVDNGTLRVSNELVLMASAHFDCSLMNDCVRFLVIHLPAVESDFDVVLSESASSGVALTSAHAAFAELLRTAALRIVPGIFEV